MSDTLFIKFDDYSKVNHRDIAIKDIAKLYSSNNTILANCKCLKITKLDDSENCLTFTNIG